MVFLGKRYFSSIKNTSLQLVYNIVVGITTKLLPVTTIFSPKMKMFVNGRKETFSILRNKITTEDKVIWFHMASLGEFEQGLPIIKVTKKIFPDRKIVVSFFSPSGYENKKNTPVADAVVYLPLDTQKNAKKFLDIIQPELVFFIKYEFWPNYLKELKTRKIPTILISGGFRKDQLFFKPYGKWMKKSLETFDHFFVQNEESKFLLQALGFQNVTVNGDTRFDRVSAQLEQDNRLDFIEEFKQGKLCVVAGSTWPEDEALLENYINKAPAEVKFILAPHQIKQEQIQNFRKKLKKEVVLFSEMNGKDLRNYQVLIVDTIGLLTKIYNYSDIAYVGGAAGNTGLHNILEPATFGVPIIIGKNFEKFPEAKQLQRLAGLFSVETKEELEELMVKLVENENFRKKTGMITGHFISNNTGATQIVEQFLFKNVKSS